MLTLGFLVVVLVLVLVVSAATSVHLQRTRLMHVADEAALSAADALDLDSYYAGTAPAPTEAAGAALSHARMVEAVDNHVAQETQRLGGEHIRVVDVRLVDGHTAQVTLQATVRPLFGLEVLAPFADGITITVTGSARSY